MEFLNKAFSQVSDVFKSMTPAARITAGMLLVMIVLSLVYLTTIRGSSADRYLFGGREFTDTEIDAIQSAFAAAKLDQYVPDGRRIRVPGSRLSDYMQALNKAGFAPSDVEAPIQEAIAEAGDFMKSKEDKEFHRSQAQQLKLARTISMRPEIDWATVQFREVKREGFPPVTERKATVVACGTNRQPIDRSTLRTIRAMTSSWFGIHLEDVAVTDVNGGIVDDLSTGDGMSKEARMYADAKSHYEELWKGKIYECLAFIPGVVATVNVEVDPIISSESTKVDLDPQAVALQSESFTKTSQSRPSGGGRPGAVPNEVAGNQPRSLSTMSAQETSADESREQQVSVAGHEQTHQRQATLVPKLVTAAVSIPKSYFKRVWHERNPTAPDQEPREPTDPDLDPIEVEIMQSVEEIVTVNIPVAPSGDNSLTQVKVSSYDDLTVPPPDPPTMVATAGYWLAGNWQKIGLFIVGLISLLVLRSMTRAATPASSAAAAAVPPAPIEEEPQEEPEPHPVLHRRGASSGSSLREELTAIVREDPDAAANVLRTWIGDAA